MIGNLVGLASRTAQTPMAVVIAICVSSREGVEGLVVASSDDFIDLAVRRFVVEVMNLFRVGVSAVAFTIHISCMSSHRFLAFSINSTNMIRVSF